MAQTCGFCQQEIGETPKIELLCHHFFHTNCFLVNFGDQCAVCEQPFLPQEHQEDHEEINEDHEEQASVHSDDSNLGYTRIRTLYDTNPRFRRDIKTYMHAQRSMNKPRKEFQALLATKKAELVAPYTLIKAQVEGLYSVKKDDIMNSEQYKAYKRADGRVTRYYSNLQRNYNIRSYQFTGLHHIPGLKRLQKPAHRYWSTPARLVRRALRLRLSYW